MSRSLRWVLFVLCLFALVAAIAAQARGGGSHIYLPVVAKPSPYWAFAYDLNDSDTFVSLEATSDGGFIAAGESHAFGEEKDAWVVKLNVDGTIAWEKIFAGVGSQFFNSVQEAPDGAFFLTGGHHSENTQTVALWVVKLDEQGNVIWQKSYGEFANNGVIQVTDDGGLLLTSATFGPDSRVLKLNSNGEIIWQQELSGAGSDYVIAIYETADNGYILGGHTSSLFGPGFTDALVMKLNQDGSLAWQRTYGSAGVDLISAMQMTDTGGVILVGIIDSIGSTQGELWVIKLNNMGVLEWQKSYGGPAADNGYSVQQTADGGYVVAGVTFSYGLFPSNPTDGDVWLLKLDPNGNVIWQKTYGGFGGDEVDAAYSIRVTREGNFILAGDTESFGTGIGRRNAWVLKLDQMGDIPNCGIIGTSTAVPVTPPVNILNGTLTVNISTSVVEDTNIIPQNASSQIISVCDGVGQAVR
ncbi:MAG: hypothetical protein KJ069_18740 [Anaerolineae bacterium]|nr:hypothetical protein [Anaerolineae bacterium]